MWYVTRQSDVVHEVKSKSEDYSRFSACSKRRILRNFPIFVTAAVSVMFCLTAFSAPVVRADEPLAELFEFIEGETDFETAKAKAKENRQNLLIYFYAEQDSPSLLNETEEKFVSSGGGPIRQVSHVPAHQRQPLPIAENCRKFEKEILSDANIVSELRNYVVVRLPMETKATQEDGTEVRLLESPQFKEMQGMPGLATFDFANPGAAYYGELTGILPFLRAKLPTMEHVETFLTLPPGTVTQRTLIYAVRIHPENPLSTTTGFPQQILFDECQGHSEYQAKTGVLGHQNFGARTSRISAALGAGASEVCAQSWSGEGLYEAAIGCVRAWRGSPGHWNGVRGKNRYYGYDMVRGRSGIWYATGLFVK